MPDFGVVEEVEPLPVAEWGVEWHKEIINWMSGKRLAVIWLPTTM